MQRMEVSLATSGSCDAASPLLHTARHLIQWCLLRVSESHRHSDTHRHTDPEAMPSGIKREDSSPLTREGLRLSAAICCWLASGRLTPTADVELYVARQHQTDDHLSDGRRACELLLAPSTLTPEVVKSLLSFDSEEELFITETSSPASSLSWEELLTAWFPERDGTQSSSDGDGWRTELQLMMQLVRNEPRTAIPVGVDVLSLVYEAQACVFAATAKEHDPRTHSPDTESKLIYSMPRFFHCLVRAQDAARTAVTLFGSVMAEELIENELCPAFAFCQQFDYLHPSVEVSGHPQRVVAGTGLWCSSPVVEGELLLREGAVALWTRRCKATPEEWLAASLQTLRGRAVGDPHKVRVGDCYKSPYCQLLSQLPLRAQSGGSGETVLRDLEELCAFDHNVIGITDVDIFKLGQKMFPEIKGSKNSSARQSAGCCGHVGSDESGKGLFLTARFINHSCQPNAVLIFPPSTAHVELGMNGESTKACEQAVCVVALRDIAAGEEVTIAYPRNFILLSGREKNNYNGFKCKCEFCRDKTALQEGVCCAECSRLIFDDGSYGPGAQMFGHAADCSQLYDYDGNVVGRNAQFAAAERLRSAIDRIEREMMEAEDSEDHSAGCCSHPAAGEDPVTIAFRKLMDLDKCAGPSLLSAHYQRLQLRLTIFAAAAAACCLSLQDSAQLLQLTADVVEDAELLLPVNYPLVTGLRMYYVFARGRHIEADMAADKQLAGGGGTDDGDGCCGAVRHETEMMTRPYIRDDVLRGCVIRSLQEHHVQCVGWDDVAAPMQTLLSFMRRYPVELESAGVLTLDDFDIMSCLPEAAGTEDMDA